MFFVHYKYLNCIWLCFLKIIKTSNICYLINPLLVMMQSLDASRPWLCYWILHGLELLGTKVDAEVADGYSHCHFFSRRGPDSSDNLIRFY